VLEEREEGLAVRLFVQGTSSISTEGTSHLLQIGCKVEEGLGPKEEALGDFLPPSEAECTLEGVAVGTLGELMVPTASLRFEPDCPRQRFKKRRLPRPIFSYQEGHGSRERNVEAVVQQG